MLNFGYAHWHYRRSPPPFVCGWSSWDGTNDTTAPSGSSDIYNLTADMLRPIGFTNSCVAVVGGVASISGVGYRDAIRLVQLDRQSDGSFSVTYGSYARRTLSASGWDGNALCVLSETQVLTATCADINQSYVTLYSTDADTLTASFSSEVLFSTARIGKASLVRLSDTTALLVFLTYTTGNRALYAVKITISGSSISVSSPTSLLTHAQGAYAFDVAYNNTYGKAYVSAATYNGSNTLFVIPIDCSGSSPVADTSATLSIGSVIGVNYVSTDTRDGYITTAFVASSSLQVALMELVYNPTSGLNDAPSLIDRGVVKTFPSNIAYQYNGISIMDNEYALVTFENGASDYKVTTTVMQYDNTGISTTQPSNELVWGMSVAGAWDHKSGPIDTVRISQHELLVFYEESDWTLKARILTSGCNTYIPQP